MEIVIKIDEKDYQSLKDGHIPFNVLDVIMNGTIIPKGHGDLIDLEEVRDRYANSIKVSNSELENLRMLAEILDTSPTIIEADKEEKYYGNSSTSK